MRQYQIAEYGSVEGLKLVEVAEPQPGPGEVLVRIRATSLNYRDLMIVTGNYSDKNIPNLVPVSDGAGEVIAIGDGVTRWKTGDRVAGTFFQGWVEGPATRAKIKAALGGSVGGVLSEAVVLHEDGLVALPDGFSFEDGATLPCAALTAWHAVQRAGLTAGQTILLLGTGGVSIFGLQFAKALGAKAIITSSSDEKLERARTLGADETINYKTSPDWEKNVLELTGGQGVDHVIEVGGKNTFEKSMRSLRIEGTLSVIGGVSGFDALVNPFAILRGSLNVQGIYVGSREMFENMNKAIVVNGLKPVIDKVFPFEEAPGAYGYLQSGSHFGKIVISL